MICGWCGADQPAPLTPIRGARVCEPCALMWLDIEADRINRATPITVLAAEYRGMSKTNGSSGKHNR